MKVVTIAGTRPELIKLSRTIVELARRLDHVLVHTGQNYDYELNQVFFEQLSIPKPDHFLECAAPTASATVARVIERTECVLLDERPDALLLLGDTNSCLAAYPAKRLKIPIFHMEAGNRCFDLRVPEEINRRIVDHLSDINLVYTEHARRHLLAEGLRPETIIKTGSPMREVCAAYAKDIAASRVLETLGLEPRGYMVVSCHREENVDSLERLAALGSTLDAVRECFGLSVVFSVHPRTRARLEASGADWNTEGLIMSKPFGFFDYARLQQQAFCVLSDSGTLTEEAALLGFPAVMLRQAHERPEGMDAGTLVMSDLDPEHVLRCVRIVTDQSGKSGKSGAEPLPPPDYAPAAVSRQVVRVILSYAPYVRRTTWREQEPSFTTQWSSR